MTEKKKNYLTPLIKVVKVENSQIICASQQFKSSEPTNEIYEEVETTNSWFN